MRLRSMVRGGRGRWLLGLLAFGVVIVLGAVVMAGGDSSGGAEFGAAEAGTLSAALEARDPAALRAVVVLGPGLDAEEAARQIVPAGSTVAFDHDRAERLAAAVVRVPMRVETPHGTFRAQALLVNDGTSWRLLDTTEPESDGP